MGPRRRLVMTIICMAALACLFCSMLNNAPLGLSLQSPVHPRPSALEGSRAPALERLKHRDTEEVSEVTDEPHSSPLPPPSPSSPTPTLLPQPFLVIGIFSTAAAWRRRKAIRDTIFIQPAKQQYLLRVMFVLGKDETPAHQAIVQQEQEQFGDIIVLEMTENMNSGKTGSWLRYVLEHLPTSVRFIAKADDDSYIHLDNALQLALLQTGNITEPTDPQRDIRGSKVYCGRTNYIRSHISFPPVLVPHPDYPFKTGMYFMVSRDIAFGVAYRKSWIGPEDVVLGANIYHEFNLTTHCTLLRPEETYFFNYKGINGYAGSKTVNTVCVHIMSLCSFSDSRPFDDYYDFALQFGFLTRDQIPTTSLEDREAVCAHQKEIDSLPVN